MLTPTRQTRLRYDLEFWQRLAVQIPYAEWDTFYSLWHSLLTPEEQAYIQARARTEIRQYLATGQPARPQFPDTPPAD